MRRRTRRASATTGSWATRRAGPAASSCKRDGCATLLLRREGEEQWRRVPGGLRRPLVARRRYGVSSWKTSGSSVTRSFAGRACVDPQRVGGLGAADRAAARAGPVERTSPLSAVTRIVSRLSVAVCVTESITPPPTAWRSMSTVLASVPVRSSTVSVGAAEGAEADPLDVVEVHDDVGDVAGEAHAWAVGGDVDLLADVAAVEVQRSSPASPSTVSLPSPGSHWKRSSPAPRSARSTPWLPSTESLPVPPIRRSAPLPPRRVSLPSPPSMVSVVSAARLPVAGWCPRRRGRARRGSRPRSCRAAPPGRDRAHLRAVGDDVDRVGGRGAAVPDDIARRRRRR